VETRKSHGSNSQAQKYINNNNLSPSSILSYLLNYHPYSIIILACLLHPYFNLHFTPLSSFLRRTSCSLMILSPSYILLHNHPYTSIILTPLSSLLHYHPYSIIILTPLSSLLPYQFSIILTQSYVLSRTSYSRITPLRTLKRPL